MGSMSAKRFTDSWKRIERARLHAKAMADEWAAFFQQGTYAPIVEWEDERTAVVSVMPPPGLQNNIALELGEFFYQLRAALDAAIWQGVTMMQGTEPAADANRLEFPICADKASFQKAAFHSAPLPNELKSWLETIQPYFAEKTTDDPDSGLEVVLRTIHDCARKDRHRRLHIVAAIPTEMKYAFEFDPPATVTLIEPLVCNLFENKAKFWRIGIEPVAGCREHHIKFTTDIQIEISCDQIPVYGRQGFAGEINRFLRASEHVITRFESAFPTL